MKHICLFQKQKLMLFLNLLAYCSVFELIYVHLTHFFSVLYNKCKSISSMQNNLRQTLRILKV